MTTEEKLNRFLQSSIQDTRQKSANIIKTYTDALEAEFEDYKNSINNQIEQQLKSETNKIRILTNRELSEKQIVIKRSISQVEEELTKKIFREVEAKLDEFKSSPAYFELLVHQITAALEFAGSDEILIYIDPVDASFLDSLKNLTGASINVSTTSFLGGTRAVIRSKNILIENSFKKKLQEARDNFTFHARRSSNG